MEARGKAEAMIERARGEDARDIQEVFYRAWLGAYPNPAKGITVDDIEDKFTDAFTDEVIAKRAAYFAHPPEGDVWLVARLDGKVVGLATPNVKPDRNQLQRIYVHPDYQRRGIGMRLWEEARKYFDPAKDTFVDVVEYNAPAIAFYRKLGSEDTGERKQEERFRMKSGALFTEMVMRRPKETDSPSQT